MIRLLTKYTPGDGVIAGGELDGIPTCALIEDDDSGLRWMVIVEAPTEPQWLDAYQHGAIGVIVPRGTGYAVAHREVVAANREFVNGRMTLAERWLETHPRIPPFLVEPERITPVGRFVHLHAHSDFSPLDGMSTVEEMVRAAAEDGQHALAVTDHGVCAGHPSFQKAAQEIGIKPLFGIEAYLVDNRLLREGNDYWHFILLAMTEKGLGNLWAASTEAWLTGMYHKPRMDWETLERYSEGVIASTACLRGPLSRLILAGDEQGARQTVARLQRIYDDRLYVELHTNHLDDQIKVNEGLVSIAGELGLPLIVVADSHYSCLAHSHLHKIWIAAQTNSDISADDSGLFEGDEHYHISTAAEVEQSINYLAPNVVDEAMKNTLAVADRCDVTIKQRSSKPVYHRNPPPGQDASLFDSYATDRDVAIAKCMEAWKTKIAGKPNEDVYRERWEKEEALFTGKKFWGYMLIVEDYCLDPSTPVLTADMRWVEVGKLEVGDRLAAFDEHKVVKQAKGHRYWRSAEVVRTGRIVLPTYKVILEDGTETIASDGHPWLVSSPSGGGIRWVKTRDLRVGQRAQRLVEQWDEVRSWEAGYLAGIFDGEGWLSCWEAKNGGYNIRLGFAQLPGPVLDMALRILDAWGFEYTVRDHGGVRNNLRDVSLRGGRSEAMRLLGMVRPQRLLSKLDVDLLGRVASIGQPAIVSVEPIGLGEVVALGTSTQTLVAQGFAHHNTSEARRRGILMGPGRGSASGSLVSWLLGITGIDPIEADLMFERFLTWGRDSPPDIDTDFPSSKRDEMTQYIIDRWGADRVVRVGTHLRLKSKGVLSKLAGVLRSTHPVDFQDQKKLSDIITRAEADTAGLGLKWDELWDVAGEELEPFRQKYPEMFAYAEQLVGRLHSYGKHAAGLVIDPEAPIIDRLPLAMRGDEKKGKQVTAEFDMNALELLGFLKFDILTIVTLDTIQACMDLIRADPKYDGLSINPDLWTTEYEDPQVWDMICSGDTLGIFQIETADGTKLTKRVQPRSITDLAVIGALNRPGPMRSGLAETYMRRRFGDEPVVAAHPLLEKLLERTYQTMIFQEDVMGTCQVLGGYSLEEADTVRSILGKKKVEAAIKEGGKFLERCKANGIEEEVAKRIWEQMQEFARYSFNRAHSWGYAMLGYWCAWFKCHFPAHFLVARLSTCTDDDKARIPEFVSLARRNGYKVSVPDINQSVAGFSISSDQLSILYGLKSIPGIGDAACEAIIQNRPYGSFEDFMARRGPKCNIGHIKTLASIGAFDPLLPDGVHRAQLEVMIETFATGKVECCSYQRDPMVRSVDLCTFDWSSEPVEIGKSGKPLKRKAIPKACTKACRQYSPQSLIRYPDDATPLTPEQIRRREQETLGIYISSTPFDGLNQEAMRADNVVFGEDVERLDHGTWLICGLITGVRKRTDRFHRSMAFISIDSFGYEVSMPVFSSVWDTLSTTLAPDVMGLFSVVKDRRGMSLTSMIPLNHVAV